MLGVYKLSHKISKSQDTLDSTLVHNQRQTADLEYYVSYTDHLFQVNLKEVIVIH